MPVRPNDNIRSHQRQYISMTITLCTHTRTSLQPVAVSMYVQLAAGQPVCAQCAVQRHPTYIARVLVHHAPALAAHRPPPASGGGGASAAAWTKWRLPWTADACEHRIHRVHRHSVLHWVPRSVHHSTHPASSSSACGQSTLRSASTCMTRRPLLARARLCPCHRLRPCCIHTVPLAPSDSPALPACRQARRAMLLVPHVACSLVRCAPQTYACCPGFRDARHFCRECRARLLRCW
jgi:hypothetical protein